MSKIIISLSGFKGAGKDSASNVMISYLSSHYPFLKVKKIAFAEPIKKFINEVFNYDFSFIEKYKNIEEKNFCNLTMRKLLQNTGMAMRSIFGEDIFIKTLKNKIYQENLDIVFIPDLRFKNEYLSLLNDFPDYEFYAIKVNRPDLKVNDFHISEQEWKNLAFDYEINNNSLENLTKESINIISEIIKRHNYE